jgi:Ca-activated chloride channel family protein
MEFVVAPLLWWLLLPAVLLAAYAIAQSRRARGAIPYSSVALLRRALAGRPSTAWRRHVPPVLVLASLAIAAVALARPALRVPIPRERTTIILVLDVSGSMQANDMFPSRLEAAKRAARTFVDSLPDGFRIGVVSFSSAATLVQPITEDHRAARSAIDGLDADGGTAIGEGILVALASLPNEPAPLPAVPAPIGDVLGQAPPPPPAIILLLTDGENTEGVAPLVASQSALQASVPIFTVGMGGRGGGFGPRSRGGIDEPLLKEVAARTGGQYYYAPDGGQLGRIYRDLGAALGWDFERSEIGQYFAGAAAAAGVVGLSLGFLWLQRQPGTP